MANRFASNPMVAIPGVGDHAALIDAIAAGDPEPAAAAMRAHLLTVAERAAAAVDAKSG